MMTMGSLVQSPRTNDLPKQADNTVTTSLLCKFPRSLTGKVQFQLCPDQPRARNRPLVSPSTQFLIAGIAKHIRDFLIATRLW